MIDEAALDAACDAYYAAQGHWPWYKQWVRAAIRAYLAASQPQAEAAGGCGTCCGRGEIEIPNGGGGYRMVSCPRCSQPQAEAGRGISAEHERLLLSRHEWKARAEAAEAAGAVRHVDDMNDLVLMGLARDDAEARLKIAMEALDRISEAEDGWDVFVRIARDAKAKIEALP